MKKILFLILASTLIGLLGCATTQEEKKTSTQDVTKITADNRPCIINLTIEGGFWQGQKYSTYQEFKQANKGNAFDKMVFAIASEGYQIVNTSKELGMISASQQVSYGAGKTVPLNVILKQDKEDLLRVEITLSMSGGLVAGNMEIENLFCKIMDSVPIINEKKIIEPNTSKQINVVEEKVTSAQLPDEKSSSMQVQAPSETLPSTSKVVRILVVTKTASLRSEPNTKSKIIMTLKSGTKVESLDKSGDWFNIKLSTGVTGWVSKSLVKEGK